MLTSSRIANARIVSPLPSLDQKLDLFPPERSERIFLEDVDTIPASSSLVDS